MPISSLIELVVFMKYLPRLTERNCIEIVNRLIELKLLDVVYTSDGKEYITPQQLVKEIQDELYVHGGNNNY